MKVKQFILIKNLLNDRLNYQKLDNNISEFLKEKELELIGIRDLHFHNDQVLISLITKSDKGITIDIYGAELNFKKLIFKNKFKINEYWQ